MSMNNVQNDYAAKWCDIICKITELNYKFEFIVRHVQMRI